MIHLCFKVLKSFSRQGSVPNPPFASAQKTQQKELTNRCPVYNLTKNLPKRPNRDNSLTEAHRTVIKKCIKLIASQKLDKLLNIANIFAEVRGCKRKQ